MPTNNPTDRERMRQDLLHILIEQKLPTGEIRVANASLDDSRRVDALIGYIATEKAASERYGRLDELSNIPAIPTFLYSARNDKRKTSEAMAKARNTSIWIHQRLAELKAGEEEK